MRADEANSRRYRALALKAPVEVTADVEFSRRIEAKVAAMAPPGQPPGLTRDQVEALAANI